MITDKLTIYGEISNAQLVSDLVTKCASKLEISASGTLACFENFFEESILDREVEHLVLDCKDAEKIEFTGDVFSYSFSDSRADVRALNLQQREHTVCFELLCGSFMSRIFIPLTSAHTPQTVLVACCVLLCWSPSAEKIVETINELLK